MPNDNRVGPPPVRLPDEHVRRGTYVEGADRSTTTASTTRTRSRTSSGRIHVVWRTLYDGQRRLHRQLRPAALLRGREPRQAGGLRSTRNAGRPGRARASRRGRPTTGLRDVALDPRSPSRPRPPRRAAATPARPAAKSLRDDRAHDLAHRGHGHHCTAKIVGKPHTPARRARSSSPAGATSPPPAPQGR